MKFNRFFHLNCAASAELQPVSWPLLELKHFDFSVRLGGFLVVKMTAFYLSMYHFINTSNLSSTYVGLPYKTPIKYI